MTTIIDVLIIGAGQAGLALGYHLQKTPLSFQLVEGNERIGDSWRKRYDSLVLFTPRAYSALPGLPLPGDPAGYAGKDEAADYLETYARHFNLPVLTGIRIEALEYDNNGSVFLAETSTGSNIAARAVVLATGAFQKQIIPALAGQLSEDVRQFTSENYKNAAQVPPGTVLVVGDGASGRDIASDLQASHTVILSAGHPRKLLPLRILGKSTSDHPDTRSLSDVVKFGGGGEPGRFVLPDPGEARPANRAGLPDCADCRGGLSGRRSARSSDARSSGPVRC